MPRDKREKYSIEMVNDRLSLADDGRSDYTSRAVENEKLYHNYIDEAENPYISNISLPWPYIITESYLGKCIQVTAATMPYVHVVEEDDDSRKKARKVEKDANMVLYTQRWPILAYNIYKQAFKYGTAFIFEKPWGIYGKKEMPIFQLANYFHVWVNPTVLSLDDTDAYLIYETFLPKNYFLQFLNNPNYKNINKIEKYTGDLFTEEEREIRSFKSIPEFPADKYSNLVQTTFYWSHDDFVILTNLDNVIRDDGFNFLGRIPMKVINPIPLDNEFYGMSILEEGKDLFSECNENRNQFNDAANLMLNPQYIIDRNVGVKQKTLLSKVGNIIWTEDVNGVVPLRQDWQLLMMCLRRQTVIYDDIQNYSNAFPQLRGQPARKEETATAFLGMQSAGELRSDTYNLLMTTMGVEEIIKDIVDFKQRFMTKDSSFHYWPEGKTDIATPEDYEGNFTFKAFASFKMQRDIERKHFIEAMGFIFGNKNGAFLPSVMPKIDEWLDRLLDYFNIRNPEQLRLSEEEKMVANAQAQMQQLMLPMMREGRERPALGEKAMRMEESEPNTEIGPMMGQMMR